MHKPYPTTHELVRELIAIGGDNPDRPGLVETPQRFARAWAHWTSGYGVDPLAVLKTFEMEGHDGGMVFQANIPTYSMCEHHLAPFFGVAHIGYIPHGKVVGLSKLARLVDIFARRFQIQERLCANVADAMFAELEPRGVGVVMQMRHLCMESRGVQKAGTITITSALRGDMLSDATVRAEFMTMVATATNGIKQI